MACQKYLLSHDPDSYKEYSLWLQDCVALTRQRARELQAILDEAISGMEVD